MSTKIHIAPLSIVCERPQDGPAVERLIASAFGPGRLVKAAERLREGRTPLLELSFVAWSEGVVVGCVRQWAVRAGERAAILLGPFAVDPRLRKLGLGRQLIERACQAAAEDGHELVLLVGDKPYFAPLGFSRAADVRMPGPVDQRRVLIRPLVPGAERGVAGLVRAA
jgi:predicted N-acetyltransferase YhbS